MMQKMPVLIKENQKLKERVTILERQIAELKYQGSNRKRERENREVSPTRLFNQDYIRIEAEESLGERVNTSRSAYASPSRSKIKPADF